MPINYFIDNQFIAEIDGHLIFRILEIFSRNGPVLVRILGFIK
jgi:hypothetical protein